MMFELLEKYIEDSDTVLQTLTSQIGAFLIIGVSSIAILWVAGYTCRRVFGWFHEWTSR